MGRFFFWVFAGTLISASAMAEFESDGYRWVVNRTGLTGRKAQQECSGQGLRLADYNLLKQVRYSAAFVQGMQAEGVYQYGIQWSDLNGKPQAVNINAGAGSQFDIPTPVSYPLPFACTEQVFQSTYRIPHHWIVGGYDLTVAAARQSWTDTCREWTQFLGQLHGAKYQAFDCGYADCRPYSGHYICGSEGTLTVTYSQKKSVSQRTDLSFAPAQTYGVGDYRQAYLDWRQMCWSWMRNHKSQNGWAFLGATCDVAINIAPSGYLRFSSQTPVTYQAN